MRKTRILVPFLLTALLFSSCGKAQVESDNSVSSIETASQSLPEASSVSEESSVSKESLTPVEENSQVEEIISEEANSFKSLTEVEKDYFTEFIQKTENYGFLCSTYSDIKDVDLNQIYYHGAGGARDYSQEDMQEYLNLTGKDEVYTELVVLPKDYMENHIYKKTGYTYSELNTYLDKWFFSSNTDCYYHEIADTNFESYEVVDGSFKDDLYILRVRNVSNPMVSNYEGFHIPDRELALQKTEDGYRFVSCRNLMDEGLITEWCAQFVVPSMGTCQLMVYEPDEPSFDFTMLLYKDGEVKRFFYWNDHFSNLLEGMKYDHIVDMGFSDYNNDGFIDIAMNVNYKLDDGEDYYQLRVYSGDQYGYFNREVDIAKDCYACVGNNTSDKDIKAEVMFDLMSYSYKDLEDDWKPAYIKAIEAENASPYVTYDFLYIDNNRVPEIIALSSYVVTGNKIFTSFDGHANVLEMDRLVFKYQYMNGLILSTDGHMGYYFDRVYELKDGEFGCLFDGSYEFDPLKIDNPFDEATRFFKISNKEVTREEYKDKLSKAFPVEFPDSYNYDTVSLTKDEILKLLNCDIEMIFE